MGILTSRAVTALFVLLFCLLLTSFGGYFVFENVIEDSARVESLFVADSSSTIHVPPPKAATPTKVYSGLNAGDGRYLVVDTFLAKYGSPMRGHGADFVQAADRNGLDWRLLPAIAFQESNLGKKIPRGSYNPFGWGIYTGQNSGVRFQDWSDSIHTVARGLRKNYLEKGLTTPEKIVVKYSDAGNHEWVFAVRTAMNELSTLSN